MRGPTVKHFTTSATALLVVFAAAEASPRQSAPPAAKLGPVEWHQWRGPNRDGISPDTGLLKQWPTGGPPLAWKAAGIGDGFASVSLFGDRLYTTGDLGTTSFLFALNVSDGKIAWQTPIGTIDKPYDHQGVRSTPATDGTLVFALAAYGELVCAEAATGKERWRKHLAREFGGSVGGWKYAESPLLDGEHVVVTPGGKQGAVLALRKETGEKVWQSKEFTDGAQYPSLVPVEIGGVRQYLVFTMRSVAGIAAKDGRLLWRVDRPGRTAICTTPVYRDGIVFVSSGYKLGHNAFRVTAEGGQFKAEEIYAGDQMQNHHGGLIALGDHVYGLDDRGSMKCFELKTGREVWSDRSVGKGSIAYADGHFVVRSERGAGTVALVEATPSGYKERGRFNPPDRSKKQSWPHPVIFGGKLYIRDQDVLLCYDVKAK
jgi:outer membrane protein assembly factor BamB